MLLPLPFWPGLLNFLLAFIGPFYSIAHVGRRLAITPDALQSRVNSSARLIILGSSPLGQAFVGVLLEYSDVRLTIALLVIGQVILAIVAVLIPAIRNESLSHITD